MEAFRNAMTNRSLRTVKAELEFLAESNIITSQQLFTILSQLPTQPNSAVSTTDTAAASTPSVQPPTNDISNLNLNTSNGYPNEKQAGNNFYTPSPAVAPASSLPPPAYGATASPPSLPPLAYANALYAYNPTDVGDLALLPNDRIAVTEYMNAEWWKGRNERTNMEGIFPRSYVKTDEKGPPTPAPGMANNYGNMPLEVSGMGNGEGKVPSKGQETGKKIGKKIGNAALFGAGATIGSNLVNSIF